MSHQWQYTYVGGLPRVKISTADDIRNLPEIDAKLWTVLSCPVKGLELPEESLALLDYNNDGAIHINEVKETAACLSRVLNDLDILLTDGDSLPLDALNREDETAARLARLMEQNDLKEVTPADVKSLKDNLQTEIDSLAKEFLKPTKETHPYDENTEDAYLYFLDVREKVDDFFARCAVARFAGNVQEVVDVQMSQIESLSKKVLSIECPELECLPIARVNEKEVLRFEDINPAWYHKMFWFYDGVFDGRDKEELDELEWNTIKDKMARYEKWLAECNRVGECVLEKHPELVERKRDIDDLLKLVLLRRDFYTLLRNYVTMDDFYEVNHKAIFQAGELYIDQRCCSLCIEVTDVNTSLAQGNDTGMFLIYCHCVSKTLNSEKNIVAALTAGGVRNVKVGKHALFYDRQGNDYDATVTHIIDNPISIGQAFYSPYRKFVGFIEKQATKFASEKDQSVMDKAANQVAESTENVQKAAEVTEKSKADKDKQSAFDIAKYCGIFAAIGMAIGYIGGFLTKLFLGFVALKWWQMPIAIAGVMMLISGPSMILAWLKLRKRNLSPLLNANGWAVNTALIISIVFGNTLSTMAKIPKLQLPKKKQ